MSWRCRSARYQAPTCRTGRLRRGWRGFPNPDCFNPQRPIPGFAARQGYNMSPPRVVVGMSGGVDSSVAAALLVEQGYDIVGVTMRLWTEERPGEFSGHQQCCSVEDIDDARRVAGTLGIRHYVMNFEQEFREKVVDNFVSE